MSGPRQASQAAFDFTRHMRRLCGALCRDLSELAHIDMRRVLIAVSQARSGSKYGLQASLTPMRFRNGATFELRDGRRWEVERLFDEAGREFLYILTFYLPRFQNQTFEEKLTTVIHELWHVSPQFDGDLRRHAGSCYIHGPSQRRYDQAMWHLAQRWLATGPSAQTYGFLRYSFADLQRQFGGVVGLRVRRPKLRSRPAG